MSQPTAAEKRRFASRRVGPGPNWARPLSWRRRAVARLYVFGDATVPPPPPDPPPPPPPDTNPRDDAQANTWYQQYRAYIYQGKIYSMLMAGGIWQWQCPYDSAVVPLPQATQGGFIELTNPGVITCPECARRFRLTIGILSHG